MSVFSPLALSNSDRKRQVLQQLMEQYQQAASRAAGLASGGGGTGLPFHGYQHAGGIGHSTQMGAISELLARALGPGGYGHPLAGIERSSSLHGGVDPGHPVNPHGGGPLIPPTAVPIPTMLGEGAPSPYSGGGGAPPPAMGGGVQLSPFATGPTTLRYAGMAQGSPFIPSVPRSY